MGKGGSKEQSRTETSKGLPPWAEEHVRGMLGRAQYETGRPYEPYGGQRLAYFSPMEQAAMSGIGRLGMSGTPEELNQAGRYAFQGGQGFDPGIGVGASAGYNPGAPPGMNYNPDARDSEYLANQLGGDAFYWANQRGVGFDPGSLADAEELERYMNPYYQNVVDIEKREATRDADMLRNRAQLDSGHMGGPTGNYRLGIVESNLDRDLMQQMGDIQHAGSERAFTNAQQAFEADRAARALREQFGQSQFGMNEQFRQRQAELVQQGFSLNEAARQAQEELEQGQFGLNAQSAQFGAGLQLQAYQASEQAKQAAAQMGLDADRINQAGQIAAAQILLGQQTNMLNASSLLGDFAGQRQDMEMDRLRAMLGVGGMERGLMQQGLDIGYEDFLAQRQHPLAQLQAYSNLMSGAPMPVEQTSTTYGRTGSSAQQALGTGIAALGLWNAFS